MSDISTIKSIDQQRDTDGGSFRNFLLAAIAPASIASAACLSTLTYYAVTEHRAAVEASAQAKNSEVDLSAMAAEVTKGLTNMYAGITVDRPYIVTFGDDLQLFRLVENGTEFKGFVTARIGTQGPSTPVMVTVYADGTNEPIYQLDPASGLRLAQLAQENY